MIKIEFGENGCIHPSYVEYCLSSSPNEWNKDAQTEAVRVWQLCTLLPNLEAGILVDLVKGRRKYSIEDTKLIIHEGE